MHIEEAITAYLLAHTGLSALISRRFFFEEMPQNTTFPAVVVIKISDIKEHSLSGQLDLERPTYQFTSFATTKAGSRAVSEQLKLALVDYKGVLSGVVVQKIELQTEISSMEKTADGTLKIYTEDLEFQVNYEK